MKHTLLEQERRAHARKRRAITLAIGGLCLLCAIVFSVLYVQSAVVEEIDYGFGVYRSVTYHNPSLVWGVGLGWLAFACAVIVFVGDLLFTRLRTVEVDGCYITLYRGLLHTFLYVDGEQRDGGLLVGYHLEAPLPDGTRVHAALGKWSAYMTFSDNHPPIEL